MSLYPGDERRRDRSRSVSRDRRPQEDYERSRPSYAESRESSYAYPEDDLDDRYYASSRREAPASGGGLPYPSVGGFDNMMSAGSGYSRRANSPPQDRPYKSSRETFDERLPGAFPDDERRREDESDRRRDRRTEDRSSRYGRSDGDGKEDQLVRYGEPRDKYDRPALDDDKLKYLPSKYSGGRDRDDRDAPLSPRHERPDVDDGKLSHLPSKYRSYNDEPYSPVGDSKQDKRRRKKEQQEEDLAYGKAPPRASEPDTKPTYGSYFSPTEDKRSSRYDPRDEDAGRRRDAERDPAASDLYSPRKSYRDDPRDDPRSPGADTLGADLRNRDRDRSRDRRERDRSPAPNALTVDPESRARDRSRDGRGGGRDRSPLPPTTRMSTLTVDTGRSSNLSLSAAPPSPLLESYHGTYQACSPMPSPLLLASGHPMDEPPLSPLASDSEFDGKKRSRRARFHDPEEIAARMASALRGDMPPDINVLIDILPGLTHEQVMELRIEYKKIVKTGTNKRGVNVAKHVRSRLKDEEPNLMKACYSVALGQWESEAYWANYWYQGDKNRRELLIESLMGRTNQEIAMIKESFQDKKYNDSLTKCMETELKEDKFKRAVMMILDERRMEETDYQGRRLPLDYELVDKDVATLRKAVKADKGGESAMISIVVQRSDSHLRAILKEYDHAYHSNFARDCLKKSGNLVGELLAHILNGVINRPVRDALLLHHALTASRKDDLRRELLTSRLVRFHWDALHMRAVKKAYAERYGRDVTEAVREVTTGQWGVFCKELCVDRVPNDVRRIERVQK